MRRRALFLLLSLALARASTALAVDGYRLVESTAASVNGEVLFRSEVAREVCFQRCAAMPGSDERVLSPQEGREQLISDTLVLQEQRKLQLGQVDNAVLAAYGKEALARMEKCGSPCRDGITAKETGEWVERKLLIRDFLKQRVEGFVEIKEEDVQQEYRRRAVPADNTAELSEEQVREELLEAKVAQEVRNWYARAASKSRIVLSPLEER